jgi:hypothetical protein
VEGRAALGDHDERIRRNDVCPVVWDPEFAPLLVLGKDPPLLRTMAIEEQSELLPKPRVERMRHTENAATTVTIACIPTCRV